MAAAIEGLYLLALAGWLLGLCLLGYAEWSNKPNVWQLTAWTVRVLWGLIGLCAGLTIAFVLFRNLQRLT